MENFKLYDQNNFGCKIRDVIYEKITNLGFCKRNGVLVEQLLIDKLDKVKIPKKYWGDILIMCEHNKYDRMVDTVENLLERVVIQQMIADLINEGI